MAQTKRNAINARKVDGRHDEVDLSCEKDAKKPCELSLNDLVIDAEYQQLLPPLSDEERRLLDAEFEENGVQDALVVEEGSNIVVDGMNRWRWYKNKFPDGIVPGLRIRFMRFADREEAKKWIIRNQLSRRKLTLAQVVLVALKLKPGFEEKAKQNRERGVSLISEKGQQPVDALEEVAKLAGVSRDTASKVEFVQQHGTPEILAAMASGSMSIHAAATAASCPTDDQREIAQESKTSKKAAANAAKRLADKRAAAAEKPHDDVDAAAVTKKSRKNGSQTLKDKKSHEPDSKRPAVDAGLRGHARSVCESIKQLQECVTQNPADVAGLVDDFDDLSTAAQFLQDLVAQVSSHRTAQAEADLAEASSRPRPRRRRPAEFWFNGK